MALFDKLNQVAKNIGDKAGEAFETGKSGAKLLSEKNAISKDFEKIGEYYYNLFAAGAELAPEVVELCQSVQAHYVNIEAAQAEIDRAKAAFTSATAPQSAAPAGVVCTSCGEVNGAGAKFCKSCGGSLEEKPKSRFCPGCGAAVAPGVLFCGECGYKLEG